MFGRLVASPCLLEPFRNPVHPDQIRSCILKRLVVCAELQRQAKDHT